MEVSTDRYLALIDYIIKDPLNKWAVSWIDPWPGLTPGPEYELMTVCCVHRMTARDVIKYRRYFLINEYPNDRLKIMEMSDKDLLLDFIAINWADLVKNPKINKEKSWNQRTTRRNRGTTRI